MRIIALLSLLIASPLMGMFRGTPIAPFFYGRTAVHPFVPPYPKQQKQRPLRLEINAIKTNTQQAKIDFAKWKSKEVSKPKK